jgi:hypothetical protein
VRDSFAGMSQPDTGQVYEVENAVLQWEEGYRKLQEARSDAAGYRTLGRGVVAVRDELRKRLGSAFSVAELAGLYREASDWSLELALGVGPGDAKPVDPAIATDAAFYLYMREASDFAGGRAG